MKRRALLKLLGLFSAVRGYNIAMVCVAQYLASIFVLSKQSWREVLSDTHLLMLVIAGGFSYRRRVYYQWFFTTKIKT